MSLATNKFWIEIIEIGGDHAEVVRDPTFSARLPTICGLGSERPIKLRHRHLGPNTYPLSYSDIIGGALNDFYIVMAII